MVINNTQYNCVWSYCVTRHITICEALSGEYLPKTLRYDWFSENRLSINNWLIPIRLSINEKIRK